MSALDPIDIESSETQAPVIVHPLDDTALIETEHHRIGQYGEVGVSRRTVLEAPPPSPTRTIVVAQSYSQIFAIEWPPELFRLDAPILRAAGHRALEHAGIRKNVAAPPGPPGRLPSGDGKTDEASEAYRIDEVIVEYRFAPAGSAVRADRNAASVGVRFCASVEKYAAVGKLYRDRFVRIAKRR